MPNETQSIPSILEAATRSTDRTDDRPIDRPIASDVINALLHQEQVTRKTRSQFLETQLMGRWRLHFVTLGKVRLGSKRLRGFFLPPFLPAAISFQPKQISPDQTPDQMLNQTTDGIQALLEVTNQVTIGLIQLTFTGPARFEPKKNLLGFDFTHLVVKAFGQPIYQGPVPSPRANQNFQTISIGRLPFFAFFAVTDSFIAARGRGGGLAIWVKDSIERPS